MRSTYEPFVISLARNGVRTAGMALNVVPSEIAANAMFFCFLILLTIPWTLTLSFGSCPLRPCNSSACVARSRHRGLAWYERDCECTVTEQARSERLGHSVSKRDRLPAERHSDPSDLHGIPTHLPSWLRSSEFQQWKPRLAARISRTSGGNEIGVNLQRK